MAERDSQVVGSWPLHRSKLQRSRFIGTSTSFLPKAGAATRQRHGEGHPCTRAGMARRRCRPAMEEQRRPACGKRRSLEAPVLSPAHGLLHGSDVHSRHVQPDPYAPGPEAWVVLEGEQCLETPEGVIRGKAGTRCWFGRHSDAIVRRNGNPQGFGAYPPSTTEPSGHHIAPGVRRGLAWKQGCLTPCPFFTGKPAGATFVAGATFAAFLPAGLELAFDPNLPRQLRPQKAAARRRLRLSHCGHRQSRRFTCHRGDAHSDALSFYRIARLAGIFVYYDLLAVAMTVDWRSSSTLLRRSNLIPSVHLRRLRTMAQERYQSPR